MPFIRSRTLASLLMFGFITHGNATETSLPSAIAAPGFSPVLKLHAEGAQVYECKLDADGKLVWSFREPIATLFSDGKTAGLHYAGPNWKHSDGSAVTGKVVSNAPGASSQDIPWLKLEVASQNGNGTLTGVAIVQRINTQGGKAEGSCATAGAYLSAPYSADYVFLKKT